MKALVQLSSKRWNVNGYTSDGSSDSERRTEVQSNIIGPDRIGISAYFTADEAREYAAALIAAADACDAAREHREEAAGVSRKALGGEM